MFLETGREPDASASQQVLSPPVSAPPLAASFCTACTLKDMLDCPAVLKAFVEKDSFPGCSDHYLRQVVQDAGFNFLKTVVPSQKGARAMQVFMHPAGALVLLGLGADGHNIVDAKLCYQWAPRIPSAFTSPDFCRPFGMKIAAELAAGGEKNILALAAMEDPRNGLKAAMKRLQAEGDFIKSWCGHDKLAVHQQMFEFFACKLDPATQRNDIAASRIYRMPPEVRALTNMTVLPAPAPEAARYKIPHVT